MMCSSHIKFLSVKIPRYLVLFALLIILSINSNCNDIIDFHIFASYQSAQTRSLLYLSSICWFSVTDP